MSRSGYVDDFDDDLEMGRWRAQVMSATRKAAANMTKDQRVARAKKAVAAREAKRKESK
jgi:hypothetical protein